jgi:hypothetical protein
MKHLYFFVVDQETHLILCDAPNYEIANKLCEYVLNTSVMRIRTDAKYYQQANQILLQRKNNLTRPGETSVAKPVLNLEEEYSLEYTDVTRQKIKDLLEIKKEALLFLEDTAERFLSRYTQKYLHYTDDMVLEWSKHSRLDFESSKNYIQMQNESYLFGKAKLDGAMFYLTQMVDTIETKSDIDKLKIRIDKMVYNS